MNKSKIPWMEIAKKELGTKEIGGSKHNPKIIGYHAATKLKAKTDEVAWCASFACWILETAGLKSTDSAWARSYTEYGLKLDKPRYGCVAVYERNGPGGDSHVCFWAGEKDGYDLCLGGNQSNQVSIAKQDKKRILAYRWPHEAKDLLK